MRMEFKVPNTPPSLGRELKQAINERNLLTAKSRKKVCNMLEQDSPIRRNDSDKRQMFRMQAIEEIITSERVYLKKLEILIKYFIEPLKEQAIITDSIHTKLFGQVEVIYNLNKEFFKELEENALNIAKAILKMAPFFKLYSVYAFDYKNALLILQNLTNQNPVFRQLLKNNESRPEVQAKLNSLMIEPIQRVPRYKLLLEQILSYTSPAESDYKMIKESIKLMESICFHINSVIEDQEITQRLVNLQNSLVNRTPSIVKPSRKVIKEGILNKITRNGIQDRYCVLMSDIFMYCKILKNRSKNTLVENSLECCCIFPLKKCKVIDIFPGSFKIRCQGDGIVLCTMNEDVGIAWSSSLKDAIEQHIECRKTLRKESSKRKPMRGNDIKNFEEDTNLCSNKRKYEYESVYRNKRKTGTDEAGTEPVSCFNINVLEAKRRFCNRPNWISKSTLSKVDRKPITREDNDVYDPSFGFASRVSSTKSYFRAHNIDSTISPALTNSKASNIKMNTSTSKNVLFPLRSNNYNTDDGSYALTDQDKENANMSLPPLKKVKFDTSKLDKTRQQKPVSYQFTKKDDGNMTQPTLRQRIANFFSNLF